MVLAEIHNAYDRTVRLLDGKELQEAFVCLQALIAGTGEYDMQERLDELRETYMYMLRYRMDGVKDPMQEQIYRGLLTSVYEFADAVKHRALAEPSPAVFYARRRLSGVEFYMEYAEFHARLGASAGVRGLEDIYDAVLATLFHKVWLSDLLTAEKAADLRPILLDGSLPYTTGCQIVSALFMGLQAAFDKEKMNLLFDAAQSPEGEVRIRALVCILVILYLYRNRVELYPQITNRLEALAESDPGFTKMLLTITLRFILARETEKITRKLQDEIMPEMIKLSSKMGRRISAKEFFAEMEEEDMNPEWESILSDSGLEKKMQEFGEWQQEGADMMHSTFLNLKNFSFFREFSYWFLPFTAGHSSLQMDDESPVDISFINTIGELPLMCNSDKYSLLLSMRQIPEESRRTMIGRFNSQASEMIRQGKEELVTRWLKIERVTGQYVQDLYRFYKLHPSREDFNDIFLQALDFYNLPVLQPYLSGRETLMTVAEYHLHKDHYAEALDIFRRLVDDDRENHILFQKIGYCRQMQDDLPGALEAYLHAELLNAESKWVIKRIAGCYRSLKQPEKALAYYRRCETLLPDDLSIQTNIGHCLLELKEYDEALKYYFKVGYLDNQVKAWRPIAWCSFLTGKYRQARNYYGKIMDDHPVMQDYLNAGHTEWALQHIREALELYRKAVEAEGDFDKFREQFDQDIPNLLKSGIEEREIPLMLDTLRYRIKKELLL